MYQPMSTEPYDPDDCSHGNPVGECEDCEAEAVERMIDEERDGMRERRRWLSRMDRWAE
jgi:hypothetical protein